MLGSQYLWETLLWTGSWERRGWTGRFCSAGLVPETREVCKHASNFLIVYLSDSAWLALLTESRR